MPNPTTSSVSIWRDMIAWPRSRFWLACVDLYPALAAAALPWSTSAVTIFMSIWLVVLLPTINPKELRESLRAPASYMPAALFALAVMGLLWTNVDQAGKIQGFGPVVRFAFLPLLIYHFQRSQRPHWVFLGFLASCSALMAVSWVLHFVPTLKVGSAENAGVPIKNYIDQTQEFTLCIFGLLPVLVMLARRRRIVAAIGSGVLLLGFIENLAIVAMGRTALLYLPVLTFQFIWKYLNRTAAALVLASLVALVALNLASSTYLQQRIERSIRDLEVERSTDLATSQGLRLFYWRTSLEAIQRAPIFGHGTGSTKSILAEAAKGKDGEWGNAVRNPHNQTLYVAVQWGLVGVIVLFAMWLAHLSLFFGRSMAHWVGLIVVTQNIISSLLNSHLFDFNEGWLYVLGVGVAGGAIKRVATEAAAKAPWFEPNSEPVPIAIK